MLPSIDRLNASGKTAQRKCCRMLILAPTRELAGQIAQSSRDYSALTALRTQSIFGGTSVSKDRQKMMRGTDILVARSEEHTSELQSLMRISYAVFCLKKKTTTHETKQYNTTK